VFNRHQEFTELTVVFFLRFLTRPVLEAGLYLSVLTTPPPPCHYKRPAFNGIQATIRGFTVSWFQRALCGRARYGVRKICDAEKTQRGEVVLNFAPCQRGSRFIIATIAVG